MGREINSSSNILACFFFLIFVPILAHFSFSWMGFCPTDDGLNLALARRILEGQVPHRDFINIRPIGSALLHVPFVAFGVDTTLWVSRLSVWFEFACIAWAWTSAILKWLNYSQSALGKFLLAGVAFIFTTHTFPVMTSYTVDGLFFLSVGLVLSLRESRGFKLLGYVFLGGAVLFKQSFWPTVPAFVMILGDWRQSRLWLAAAIPGILYFVYLFFTGAIPDAVLQLGSHADKFFSVGIKTYLREGSVYWGMALGALAVTCLFGQTKYAPKWLGVLILYGVILNFPMRLSRNFSAPLALGFGLFGTVMGAMSYFMLKTNHRLGFVRIGLLVLVTAWSVSISVGYRTPVLAAGPMVLYLIALCHAAYRPMNENGPIKKLSFFLITSLFVISLWNWTLARQKYVFKDRPASELTQELDGVFHGARLIKTNLNTYRFLTDFKEAVAKTQGQDFAVIPGLAAYWATSPKKNLLPVDWACWGEMSHSQKLTNRVKEDLEARRGQIMVILQKVNAAHLARDFVPLPNEGILRHIRTHFTKKDETEFFELYQ